MPLDLVTFALQNLVEEPDKLRVESRTDARGVHIEIRCAEADAGRIIGRGGRLINSLRILARAAVDGRQRVDIHLID